MWRKLLLFQIRSFSSSSSKSEIPILYSFLQPTLFPPRSKLTQPDSTVNPPKPLETPNHKTLTLESKSQLESSLNSSLLSNQIEEAWKSFKTLTSSSHFPPSHLANSLITQLSGSKDRLNLKRAFASVVFLVEKDPLSVSLETLQSLFNAFNLMNVLGPNYVLVRKLIENRVFPPFEIWGVELAKVSKRNGGFGAFLKIFEENCRVCLDEKVDCMKPDLSSCNEVLDGCCRVLGSVFDAERVLEIISSLGLAPDSSSFGSLAYLYSWKRHESRIKELDQLMDALGFEDKMIFFKNLISGYMKCSNFEAVFKVVSRVIEERSNDSCEYLGGDTFIEIVKGFVDNGRIKDLASLIIKSQELESEKTIKVENSIGFGIVNGCLELGFLDKAHRILDEMNAQGASVGVGVYSSILKAYCKENRTAEAAQLVSEVSASGLKLDASSYDSLIDAAMTSQDFHSAFSLFREMREARLPNLKMSYLTIMTGLTENKRPELMASFLDSIVDDPRIEIATHDWNSIIHAFCKAKRIEDARRTYRRMIFLRFEPNTQTYLSLINGYVAIEKYFSVLVLWNEVRRKGINFDQNLLDAFMYALVKGGFFDAVMQVVEKSQEMKIFIDKWRHKQAFMETHKKLKLANMRKRNFRKMEAVIAFKNWAGLNS